MGVRIIYDRPERHAVLYCSTSMWAFGPIFHESKEMGADENASAFLEWLKEDPRHLSDSDLEQKYSEWLGVLAKRER